MYAYSSQAINEFEGGPEDCPFPESAPICANYDGQAVINELHLFFNDRNTNLYILISIAVCFRLLSLLALLFIKKKQT